MRPGRTSTSTRRPARAARSRTDPRARRLAALRRLQAIGGARRRNPKGDRELGCNLSSEEWERVDALLCDGFTVLLQPLGDQVVIATVDLEKVIALMGDPRAALH